MTLIIWNDDNGEVVINNTMSKLQELSFKTVYNLSIGLADQSRSIFVLNVELFQKVCSLLRKNTIMDTNLVNLMLNAQKSTKEPTVLGKIDESNVTLE
jgi:hypothetical protein